jgi:hypothetical protein
MCILAIMAGYKKYKKSQSEKNQDYARPVPARNQPDTAPYPAHTVPPQYNTEQGSIPHSTEHKHESPVNIE